MSLLTDLVAHWKLNEASGTRNDSHGTNHLTDNNTVTQATGKIGDAAQFTRANSEYLSRVDNADLSVGSGIDFTIAAWVYLDAANLNMVFAAKGNDAVGSREYDLGLKSIGGGQFRFQLITGKPAASSDFVTASTFGAPSTGQWYLVVAIHDATNDLNLISVNAGTQDSAASTVDPPDTAIPFYLGAAQVAGVPGNFMDGRVDSVSFWKRALSQTEIEDLYNGGSGLDYESFGGVIHELEGTASGSTTTSADLTVIKELEGSATSTIPDWPSTLSLPFVDYGGQPRSTTLMSPRESARIIRRQRFTISYHTAFVRWVLTVAQMDEFETFYHVTLGEGNAAFQLELRYPRNTALDEWQVRFLGGYEKEYQDGMWSVSAQLDLIRKIESFIAAPAIPSHTPFVTMGEGVGEIPGEEETASYGEPIWSS